MAAILQSFFPIFESFPRPTIARYDATPSPTSLPGQTPDEDTPASPPRKFPKGVVLGPDGKPCRSCTSFADWAQQHKRKGTPSKPAPQLPVAAPADCPADVDVLGRSTWTFLHTLAASYPASPAPAEQTRMATFLRLFSDLYPCSSCAGDFREWIDEPGNEVERAVTGRRDLGDWMCRAHNEVNRKLGKDEFDCARWEERWRTGWKDGRCDG